MCLLWLLLLADGKSKNETGKYLYDVFFAVIDVVVCVLWLFVSADGKSKTETDKHVYDVFLQSLM